MGNQRNLKRLSHLEDFGQPYPRHGLILLWWFVHECVEIDYANNRMITECNPKDRLFGFHPFHNSEEFLPVCNQPYYELGNLKHPGAMPKYVTKNYDPDVRESNADRIVVSVGSKEGKKTWLTGIFVTHHLGRGSFDQSSTFRISQRLIKRIKNMEWKEFILHAKQ